MRLLFIYFYKTKGTFKEGTTVELSKKYSVKHLGKFKFRLTKRDSFQDDFYGDNIDIGAIIGENGTGKSVLINSLRERDNSYSFAVYEEEDGKFVYEGNIKELIIDYIEQSFEVFLWNHRPIYSEDLKQIYNLSIIYYSSILDNAFDSHELSVFYSEDISDKNDFFRFSKLEFQMQLNLIENSDMHKYFMMPKDIPHKYSKVKHLKITFDKYFFQYFDAQIKTDPSILDSIIELSKTNLKIQKNILNNFTKRKHKKIIDFIKVDFFSFRFIYENYEMLESYLNEFLHETNYHRKVMEFKNEELKNEFYNFLKNKKMDKSYFDKDGFLSLNKVKNDIDTFLSITNQRINREAPILDVIELFLLKIYMKHYDNIFLKEWMIFEVLYFYEYKKLSIIDTFPFPNNEIRNELFLKLLKKNNQSIIELLELKLQIQDFTLNDLSQFSQDLLAINKYSKEVEKSLFIVLFNNKMSQNNKQNIKLFVVLIYIYTSGGKEAFIKFKMMENEDTDELINRLENHFDLNKNENYKNTKEVVGRLSSQDTLEIKEEDFKIFEDLIKQKDRALIYELDPPLSSGQKAILFIFARIDDAIKNIESSNIIILLDEADLKLHLEWQRQFINDLVEFLKSYPNKNFYVLYATHSPMILSDITDDRIVFLKKEGDYSIDKSINEKKSTFGANIYDLYHDSFFMDKYMGEFAFNKINDVINMVNLYKIVDELNDDKEKENLKDYERIYNFDELFKSYVLYYPNEEIDSKKLYVKREDIKANIENKKEVLIAITKFVGEPLLRNKLEDDLNSMGREKVDIDKVVESLKKLSQKEIKDELAKYSESIQMKILKKLFASEDKS